MGHSILLVSGKYIDLYEYERNYVKSERRERARRADSKIVKSRNRRQDNLLRLKRGFVRVVRPNLTGGENPFFFTFTMFEVVSVRCAYGIFTRFIQRLRGRFGKSFYYIAVPEFQKRGAVHFHALFWGMPDEVLLSEGCLGKWNKRSKSRERFVEWLNRKGYGISQLRNERRIQHLWSYGFVDCVPTALS